MYIDGCTYTYIQNNIKIVLRKITIIIENALNAPYYKSCIQIAAWERRFTQRTYLFRSGLTIDMLPSVIKNWESGCQIRSSCASFVSNHHMGPVILYWRYYHYSNWNHAKLTSKCIRTYIKLSIWLRLFSWLCERHCKKGMKLRFNLYSFVSTSVLPLHVLSACIHVCKEEPNTKHVLESNVSAFQIMVCLCLICI